MIPEIYTLQYGSIPIEFSLIRRKRATLEIGVLPDMSVEVVAPNESKIDDVIAKVRKRASWIQRQVKYFEQFHPKESRRHYLSGETHLYLGRRYRLKVVPAIQKGVKLTRGQLVVQTHKPLSPEVTQALVSEWYLDKARIKLAERLDHCFQVFKKMGYSEPRIIIRRMSKRWGSHTGAGNILLNPNLIRAPTECIDYVITHELCHLEHKNHNRGFYDLLGRLMPDWNARKDKLEQALV